MNYEKQKGRSISFVANDNPEKFIIFLNGNNTTPVLGTFSKLENDTINFAPIVPFENGKEYNLIYKDKLVSNFSIESVANETKPEIIQIYPSKDTLPENLLKMYLIFSQPMQNVSSVLDYIEVRNVATDKKEEIFLKLENELWNKDQTMVTLWLDPGRIKTDLIPNKELGLPIKEGNIYEISISDKLRNAKGNTLKSEVKKRFYVSKRDAIIPTTKSWKLIELPKSSTKEVLIIDFNESLDAILAKESFQIFMEDKFIDGNFETNNNERILKFTPNNLWKKGDYKVLIDKKLEDLAGNNLIKLFDIDTKYTINKSIPSIENSLKFTIQ